MMNELTPYYVIDKNKLNDSLNKLKSSFNEYWNNYIIGYSFKTNSLPWIIKEMEKNGCYAEVVSDDEYSLAKLYYDSDKIIYNGMIKSKDTFIDAVKNRCIVNIDSKREIEWLKEVKDYKVGIRANFDIEKYCPEESSAGNDGTRFGFCYENGELKKAIDEIINTGNIVNGIHIHVGSKTRSVNIYKAIANIICEIKEKYNLNLEYIDIGGGYFGGMKNKPQFSDYLSEVSNILNKHFDVNKTKLIVEPGMALIGSNISYVTSVIDVKDTTYNRFVVTDGSRTQIDPLFHKTSYMYEIEKNNKTNVFDKQVICGFTCIENDRLFVLENNEELEVGDKIIYNNVGAYTMCLSPLFIKYYPDVYVKDGDELIKVREKWTCMDYKMESKDE